jgi:DNA-binding MarR family transcriptional regulator
MRAELADLLELQERSGHSVMELRVLTQLREHEDVTVHELAELLAERPRNVGRAARELAMRGLVRSRYAERREELRLAITPAGVATTQPLVEAFGLAA